MTQAVFLSIRSSDSGMLNLNLISVGQKGTESIAVVFTSLYTQGTMGTSMIGVFKVDYPAASGKSLSQFQSTFNGFTSRVDKIAAV